MANQTIFHNASPEEIAEKLSESLKIHFDHLKKELASAEADELLTQKEVCELLKIDPSTLWHWVKNGRVIKYGIAKRRYYKRSEILESLIKFNVEK